MSTIKDFENAPVGATATHDNGSRAMKTDIGGWGWVLQNGNYLDDELMTNRGYTLNRPAPTTAREALTLAWELAHEVREGQVIPAGTRYLEDQGSGLKENRARYDFNISAGSAPGIRTLKPLPEPEPEWLDAPAVLARHKDWEGDLRVFERISNGLWSWDRWFMAEAWDLRDVTPLYPKEGQCS